MRGKAGGARLAVVSGGTEEVRVLSVRRSHPAQAGPPGAARFKLDVARNEGAPKADSRLPRPAPCVVSYLISCMTSQTVT
jgi:hypothetical protein